MQNLILVEIAKCWNFQDPVTYNVTNKYVFPTNMLFYVSVVTKVTSNENPLIEIPESQPPE